MTILTDYVTPSGNRVLWRGGQTVTTVTPKGQIWTGKGLPTTGHHLAPPPPPNQAWHPIGAAVILGVVVFVTWLAAERLAAVFPALVAVLKVKVSLRERLSAWRWARPQFRRRNRAFQDTPLGHSISLLLARSGSTLLPVEFLLMLAGLAVGGQILGTLFRGLPGGLLGLVLAPLIVIMGYRSKAAKRLATFDAGLPEALRQVANALRAGSSDVQAFGTLEAFSGVIGEEITVALRSYQTDMNTSLSTVLAVTAERMNNRDMARVAAVIAVQSDTGGNLVSIISRQGEVIRSRFALRRKVGTLTAQARISAILLACIPVVMAVAMIFVGYSRFLFSGLGGEILLGGLVWESIGVVVLMKLVQSVS